MPVLVGRKAPDFTKAAVRGNGDIEEHYNLFGENKGKYVVLFFYPLDFTFVCPSELIAVDHRLEEFKKRNTEILGVSIDSQFTHAAWRKTPVKSGGIGEVGYPLIADTDHSIAQSYGVEHPEAGVAFRGAFIIDREGIVRSQIVNDLPIGRNVDEILRVIDAIQFHEEHGEVCPAGWNKGDKGMKPSTSGVADYLADNAEKL